MSFDAKTVALFYDGFEMKAWDRPLGRLQSDLRGALRTAYRQVRHKQLYTGYYTAFLNLKRSLESIGINVKVNDFAYARAHPYQPIGISGFPSVFDKVHLPNPSVFGPGYVPPPTEIETVMDRCNIKVATLPSDWPCSIWKPLLGDRVQPMFVSIDTDNWPDLSMNQKSIDVVVYDKIRWAQNDRIDDVLTPLKMYLEAKGLTYEVLRYGHHHLPEFRRKLSQARSMAFICEHETQGLAYQEAMSSGVPIFAWDEGILIDPHQRKSAPADIKVSSVPYFEDRCGVRFKKAELEPAFDQFWSDLDRFQPRSYVMERLNLEVGAHRYCGLLKQAYDLNMETA